MCNICQHIFRPFPSEDIMFSAKFTALLSSFARTGRPEFSMGGGVGEGEVSGQKYFLLAKNIYTTRGRPLRGSG